MTGRRGEADRDRLTELFDRALSIPAGERAAFIEGACRGRPDLAAELMSLLRSHDAAPRFLESIGERVFPDALRALDENVAGAGERIGGYEILERLGGGGMGVVYRARDVELDREVALKFLPPAFERDGAGRERLIREARAASALDHPNIAVVHEIGATEPTPEHPQVRHYIVMAFYPGETLARKIRRGRLPYRVALGHALQLVDALSRAHEAGIVHCDVKPGNVIVTDRGIVKVIDFGVARRSDADPGRVRDHGGTIAYMSPEQLDGHEVDHRADLWSTGVLMYEIIAGVRPFVAERDEDVVHAIRHEEFVPLESLCPEVPPKLCHAVHRCLSRDRSRRHASAATLLAELRSVADAVASDMNPSLAVIPFRNVGSDPEDEYFVDGLTEEVIVDLSRIRSLRVISRGSSMRLKGRELDPVTVAHDLDVRYLVDGSVRRVGGAVRITAALIDARDDCQVWTDAFDGTLDDVFEMQGQVARSVARALRLHLSPDEIVRGSDRPIRDARAYESYLRARYEAWRFSAEGLERARRYIDAAREIVGDNELLVATLGHITAMHAEVGLDPDGSAVEQIDRLADEVFVRNPASSRGHWLKAWAAFHRGDIADAVRLGEHAHALDPDDPDTMLLLGYVYIHIGRNDDARTLFERVLELDPLTPLVIGVQGLVPIFEGRYADAVGAYRRCREMDPESPFAAVFYGWALAYDRRTDEAASALEEAAERFPGTVFASYARSFGHALRGEPERAVRAITPEFEAAAESNEMFARELSHCYALAGEREAALRWIERAVDLGLLSYLYIAEHDWFLDGLRGDPRFDAILERVRVALRRISASEA